MSEAIFLLVVLKIPVVYLGFVVWWAVRAEPQHPEPEVPVTVPDTPTNSPTAWVPRGRRSGPAASTSPRRRPPGRRTTVARVGGRR